MKSPLLERGRGPRRQAREDEWLRGPPQFSAVSATCPSPPCPERVKPLTLPCFAWAPPSLEERGIHERSTSVRANLSYPLKPAVSLTTSSRGKGAWPATIVAAGGDRAGTGSRGLLGRSGAELAGLTRPPSAWSGERVRPSPIAGSLGNERSQVPTRPEQGHLPGTLADNGRAERRASSKRYY